MSSHEISTWMVNAVIAIALIEGGLLIVRRGSHAGLAASADVVANLGAGLCLLGALRSELAGAGWVSCAIWLAASGAFHVLDLSRRRIRWSVSTKRRHRWLSITAGIHSGTERQS